VIGFYLDEDLSPTIARMGRERGLDIISCHEVGNLKFTDPEQFAFATSQGRCLVTGNGRDYEPLANELFIRGASHAGVAAVPGTWRRNDYSRIVQALVDMAALYADGPTDSLFVVLH
jgi:hypothetical protein